MDWEVVSVIHARAQQILGLIDGIRPFSLMLVVVVGMFALRLIWRLVGAPLGGFMQGYKEGGGDGL